MSDFRIASRYAKALFDRTLETSSLDAVKSDIDHLKVLVKESREFVLFLQSPLYKKSSKQDALKKLFASANQLTLNVFLLMAEKHRESMIPEMGVAFLRMYNNHNLIVEVTVESAVALNNKTIVDIEAYVKANSNAKTIQLTQNINPSLIGGLTIEFGGRIYDNTVSNQLRKIKKELQLA
jgi:F-type H+-transporting ATPase subunit delta